MSNDLLRVALDLTERNKRRPKQASMRRAISTAYYALFHAVLEAFADQVVGSAAPWDVYVPVYRFPDHASLARRLAAAEDHQIKVIASTLTTLQNWRITADYDPRPFLMGKTEAQEFIIQAQEAIVAVKGLAPGQRRALAAALLSATRR